MIRRPTIPIVLLLLTACAPPVELARTRPSSSDAGPRPDAESLPDDAGVSSEPKPCLRDQGGPQNRGCDPGQVCNVQTGTCAAGRPCADNDDCNPCSETDGVDCGHGFRLTAWCDRDHGRVCVRSRAPCEPCDDNCGRLDPELFGGLLACLDYPDGQRFCGRPCSAGCPNGFVCVDGQCVRTEGCTRNSVICPAGADEQNCRGTEQICAGEPCPNAPDAVCVTNDLPGALGLCIGACLTDDECPENLPLCNPRNGICTIPCDKGNCSPDQTCHSDGLCWPACDDDQTCEARDPDTYCNLPDRAEPRAFKAYRDARSCAPIGCERPEDCGAPGTVCSTFRWPPACVPGCQDSTDCASGEVCKTRTGAPDCAERPDHDEPGTLGVCCSTGCTDRTLQCGINEFCCGELESPYARSTDCGGQEISAGVCFDAPTDPFCQTCIPGQGGCTAAWPYGANREPGINGGQLFDEQSFCFGVAPNRGICSVGYAPARSDPGAPRGWICEPYAVPCLTDADCGGAPCVGANSSGPTSFGACRCGENGAVQQPCPVDAPQLPEPVAHPRCRQLASLPSGGKLGDLFCVAAYACRPPPADPGVYPAACDL